MSRDPDATSRHPAPHAEKLPTGLALFMLFGGPAAWLVQVCLSASMLSWSCYPMTERLPAPMPGYGWTRIGALVLLALCVGVALAAGFVSRAKLNEVKNEKSGGHAELIEVGHGRTRFTALWGVILGFGFTIASLLTLVAFIMVPRCVG